MKTVELNTNCGKIKGLELENSLEFRGIRYAVASRWEYPKQVTKFDGIYDATEFKSCSIQHRAFLDDAKVNAFYHKEFRQGLKFDYSEDCQYLNIYTPKDASNSPVFIYIHGGSFTGGSSNEHHIDGTNFAENGVIFVAFNYRLNAFGFCSHPDITDGEGVCGNFGLFDQVAAIKWVKDNIASFGGNPDNITLAGQSAGAMSVDILMSSPLCKNLFQRAIMMSGGGIQREVARPLSPEKTREFWDEIVEYADCGDIFELKKVDKEVLWRAWDRACKENKTMSMLYTMPVYDGKLLTKDTFNMKSIPKMPKIIGLTKNDMFPIILKRIYQKWLSADKGSDCYIYLFARDLPGDSKGAWHSSDLLYAFGTLKNNYRPFEKTDYEISNQIAKSFISFAKNGNPNCNAIPKWEKGGKKIMTFCENTRSKSWQTLTLINNTFHGGFEI